MKYILNKKTKQSKKQEGSNCAMQKERQIFKPRFGDKLHSKPFVWALKMYNLRISIVHITTFYRLRFHLIYFRITLVLRFAISVDSLIT